MPLCALRDAGHSLDGRFRAATHSTGAPYTPRARTHTRTRTPATHRDMPACGYPHLNILYCIRTRGRPRVMAGGSVGQYAWQHGKQRGMGLSPCIPIYMGTYPFYHLPFQPTAGVGGSRRAIASLV